MIKINRHYLLVGMGLVYVRDLAAFNIRLLENEQSGVLMQQVPQVGSVFARETVEKFVA